MFTACILTKYVLKYISKLTSIAHYKNTLFKKLISAKH